MEALGKRLTIRFTLINIIFWSLYGTCWGFLTVTLGHVGLTSGQSGIVICLALMLSALVSPILSSFADGNEKITSRRLAITLMSLTAVIGIALWFSQSSPALFAVLYVLLGIVVISMSPFLNAMCMELVRRGVNINYGLSRGVGSVSYAVTALLLGDLIAKFSPVFTLWMTSVMAFCVILAILWFHPGKAELPPEPASEKKAVTLSTFAFLKANPKFLLVMFGSAMLMGAHCFLNSYMNLVVERVGGDASSMGVTLGLSAAAELPAMLLFMHLRKKGVSTSKILCGCSIFFMLKPLAALAAGSVTAVYIGQLLQFGSAGFLIPLIPYYVTDTVDSANQVKGQGLMAAANNGFGAALASLFGGTICDLLGVEGGLLFAAGIALVGIVSVFIATRTSRSEA